MLENVREIYRIFLPAWVFITSNNDYEIHQNAMLYLKRNYPECVLIEVRERFALCQRPDNT